MRRRRRPPSVWVGVGEENARMVFVRPSVWVGLTVAVVSRSDADVGLGNGWLSEGFGGWLRVSEREDERVGG